VQRFGSDSLATGAGDDIVFGNQNNDTVDARDDSDLVFGGSEAAFSPGFIAWDFQAKT
jgi:hypothetical protein